MFSVDAVDAGNADADLCGGQDALVEGVPHLGFERLGVGDALGDVAGIEDHRGGDHRPRQRTAAGLVDAGHRAAVELQLDRLQLEARLHGANRSAPFSRASRRRAVESKGGARFSRVRLQPS